MMRPATSSSSFNFNAITRKIDVDNRISLRNYYRIADNLLRQANIYREEKNLIDLYVMLLRYSSLVSETIPYHRDYQTFCQKEKASLKRKLLAVLDELENLKPQVRSQLDMLEKVNSTNRMQQQVDSSNKISYASSLNNKNSSSLSYKRMPPAYTALSPALKQSNDYTRVSSSNSIGSQFQKLSLSLPLPKQETLSRHSFLGPNGLHGHWRGPSSAVKVHYPTNIVVDPSDFSSLNQNGQDEPVAVKDSDTKVEQSTMESVLSLDDGRWLSEDSIPKSNEMVNDDLQLDIIRQPSPPPVLVQVEQQKLPVDPGRVADPRPGPPDFSQNGLDSTNSIHDLHVPVKIMDEFLRLARENTKRNLETCGVLAGSLQNRIFQITTLIIPKQESTSDTCQTVNEEEIFDYQDQRSLFPLGWIHWLESDYIGNLDYGVLLASPMAPCVFAISVLTSLIYSLGFWSVGPMCFMSFMKFWPIVVMTHPSQTCFMSSVDLHTHYSYQVMLPEAIAIVMAPTDTSRPHGIFHLSDPGVSVIRKCQLRGFHSHEQPEDGSPIYQHCAHVYMNSKLKFDVVDLRGA